MKKKKRHVWLVFDLTIIALVFALGYMALNAPFAHRYYFSLIEDKAGWQISVEDLSINPFLGSIAIRQANVLSPTGREQFAADSIKIRVSPLSIVRSQLLISEFKIGNLFLDFEKRGAKKTKEGPKKPKFTVDYIRELAEKIANSFSMKNIAIEEAQVGPIAIHVHKVNGTKIQLTLDDFSFYHVPTLLRKSDFGFTAEDFQINQDLIGSRIELNSSIESKRVIFHKLSIERPEGSYRLRLKARVRRETIKASLSIRAKLPQIFHKPIKAELAVQLLPPNLQLDSLKIKFAEGSVEGSGSWNLTNQDYRFDLSAEGLSVPAAIDKLVPVDLKKTQGEISIQAKAVGRFPKLQAEAKISGQLLAYEIFRIPKTQVETKMVWPQIGFNAALLDAERRVAVVKGDLAFHKGRARPTLSSLNAELHQLALATHISDLGILGAVSGGLQLGESKEGFSGKARLQITAGKFGKVPFEKLILETELKKNRLDLRTFELHSSALPEVAIVAPLSATFRPEDIVLQGAPFPGLKIDASYLKKSKIFKIKSLIYRKFGKELTASGEYRLDKTFQANVRGEIDAHALENYRAVFKKAEGTLVLAMAAHGSTKQPVFSGSLRFKRALIGLRGMGEPLRDLNGTIRIDHNRVTLDRIEGFQGDGGFRGSGTIQLNGLKPERFNLSMQGNALSFRLRGEMQIEFDADLSLVGAMPSPLVKGKVDILSGRYYKNFRITKVVFRETMPTRKRGDLAYGFFNEWRWDLKIRNNGELRIKNNVADVYLFGDLSLKGTTARPKIHGVVTTGVGKLHYLGHDMQITEGTLEFRDPIRIRPYLTIDAQEEVAGSESRGIHRYYTVKVRLEGPIDNLQTELSSQPPVDRADVVSLLAFGMRQSELRARGASRSAFATSLIAGSLSSGLGASLGETVGLDVLRFEAAEGSTQAISGVAFGKNLSDRLSVEFYTDITPETAQRRIRSKYYLTDNIFLEGANTIDDQRTKFELNLSLQFRIP